MENELIAIGVKILVNFVEILVRKEVWCVRSSVWW
jgi:hypothetical protein